jgi:hypothetical protein
MKVFAKFMTIVQFLLSVERFLVNLNATPYA